MRLKSSIFLWVSLATVIPLSGLVLGITAYSERLYRRNVDDTMLAGMKNIVSELEFRFNYEREVMLSLAGAPVMSDFSFTLNQVARGELPSSYFDELTRLNEFLNGFQRSVSGIDTVRVIDHTGATLIKVRFAQPAGTEAAPSDNLNASLMAGLGENRREQLVYGELFLSGRPGWQPLLNPVVPLRNEQKDVVGYVAAESRGEQLDHLLRVLPRSHNFKVEIVELNPLNPERHGLILYSDRQNIFFNQLHDDVPKLWQQLDQQLWNRMVQDRQGMFVLDEQSLIYYYRDFYPYNNQQVSWLVVLQLDNSELTAPFKQIRLGLLVFAALAILISLALANVGARNIANPIAQFSAALKRYADGEKGIEYRLNQPSQAAEELQQLELSFKYLVQTLKQSEQERDRAQSMMLQQAKLASIGEMAAGIGHEINNPLNNILSYVKLMERDLPDSQPQLKQDLDGLRNEALRAGRIVKGVLNFARQVKPEYSCFDMLCWLQDCIQLVTPEAHKYQVSLVTAQIQDIELCGDRNQLQQVMVNLLMNAIQASDAHDRVIVSAQRLGTELVQIVVSDEGTGLDAGNKSKIFDPFFTTKAVGEGSGLGLSISLGIVQFHNGLLELENNERGGVDAIITLPLGDETNAEPETRTLY